MYIYMQMIWDFLRGWYIFRSLTPLSTSVVQIAIAKCRFSLWIWRASSTSHFNSAPCEPMHLGGMMVTWWWWWWPGGWSYHFDHQLTQILHRNSHEVSVFLPVDPIFCELFVLNVHVMTSPSCQPGALQSAIATLSCEWQAREGPRRTAINPACRSSMLAWLNRRKMEKFLT